ncbi:AAA family ATPase [Treponema endosymbiont of Eucomonympha sp.]|uniref:AAA family ATPase n=1 Tax=Treponema endosymbiont of Eucomonympha sp. TaxID=1580831 RepID=UPI000AC710DB|nr:AAA family ATPase [Treponema endosymbiont of Eucomonympha sp.]
MKESILIKNFGPIKEIEIDDIRPFTVFIGESGSGKSTIMKVLVLFRWLYKMLNIRSYLRYAKISHSPFSFDFKQYLKNNGIFKYLRSDSEIRYQNGKTIIHYRAKLGMSKIVPEDELSLEKMAFIGDRRNIIPDILANKVDIRDDFFLKETRDDFWLASDPIKEMAIDYLNIQYFRKQTSLGVKHFIKGNDYTINFEDASSGMQTVVPLSVIVEYFAEHYDFAKQFNDIIFGYMSRSDSLKDFKAGLNISGIKHRNIHIHIEEPELSLYPESQRSLIDFIVNRCFIQKHNGYNMTVMMATHSPYIINHLNLLIQRHDKENKASNYKYDDMGVYQIEDGKLHDLKITNKRLIDTNPLSEPINAIYDEYEGLK